MILFRELYRAHGFEGLYLPCCLTLVLLGGMNIAHGRLNAIVPGYVLQRERVGAAACFGEKSVSQSVQTRVRVGLDPGPERPHLGLQHPGSQSSVLTASSCQAEFAVPL